MADIVSDFLDRLKAHAPDLPAAVPQTLECELRQHWGGNEVYVGKRVNRTVRAALVANGLRQRRPLGEVFAQAGVSRRTGYRILGSK
jgi:hypothetical protein